MIDKLKFDLFIKEHKEIINVWGDVSDVNLGEAILITEKVIGNKLPSSYIWFFRTYGGGEILSDPLLGPYGSKDKEDSEYDIGSTYIVNLSKSYLIKNDDIEMLYTSLGERFVFDYSQISENGEVPIYVEWEGGNREKYANDYLEFIMKWVEFIKSTGT